MATTPNAATPADLAWSPRALLRRLRGADEIAHLITLIAAATLLLITVLLVYQLWVLSAEARTKFGWNFFVTRTWDPVAGQFGALPFIYGTLVTSAVALALAALAGEKGPLAASAWHRPVPVAEQETTEEICIHPFMTMPSIKLPVTNHQIYPVTIAATTISAHSGTLPHSD